MNAIIGQPLPRPEGVAKVTGAALYALDVARPGMLHGALLTSTIATGRIASLDSTEAEALPGVHLVLTHRNMSGLKVDVLQSKGGYSQSSFRPMQGEYVHHHGQLIGMVVADDRLIAEQAASLIRIRYEIAPDPKADLDEAGLKSEKAEEGQISIGDAEAALAASAVTVDARYATSMQHHNPIETYAILAEWQGDRLTVHIPSQFVGGMRGGIATAFGLEQEQVRVISPHTGGGFGSKATVLPSHLAAIAAARLLDRPVQLQVQREEGYTTASFRPADRIRVRLGADAQGKVTAFAYECRGQTSRFDNASFAGGQMAARMLDFPAIEVLEEVVPMDINTPGFMRAPAETPAFFAAESAIDELCVKLGMDPIAFRRLNEPAKDPVKGVPWSSRSLLQCYDRGAALFGWSKRDPKPGSMTRDGELIGWGVATAAYPTFISSSSASVQLTAEGGAVIRTSAVDIGTGTYAIMTQVAAQTLGLPVDRVQVQLGDTLFTPGNCAGGSTTALATGSAVQQAANEAKAALFAELVKAAGPFHGRAPDSLRIEDGRVVGGNVSQALAEAVAALPRGQVSATAQWKHPDMASSMAGKLWKGGFPQLGPSTSEFTALAYGATFVEVHINPRLRTIRVPRLVGVFAGGTILNARTARSQLMGGMIWGVSNALLEQTEVDLRHASIINGNLAEYHVAVNADINEVIAETVEEQDDRIGPLGAKGLGEIGITGTAPAIANAVFHATGIRVRKVPILLEDILPRG